MKTIKSYPLWSADNQVIQVPLDSRLISVTQDVTNSVGQNVIIHFECDSDQNELEGRTFRKVYSYGSYENAVFIGTIAFFPINSSVGVIYHIVEVIET